MEGAGCGEGRQGMSKTRSVVYSSALARTCTLITSQRRGKTSDSSGSWSPTGLALGIPYWPPSEQAVLRQHCHLLAGRGTVQPDHHQSGLPAHLHICQAVPTPSPLYLEFPVPWILLPSDSLTHSPSLTLVPSNVTFVKRLLPTTHLT